MKLTLEKNLEKGFNWYILILQKKLQVVKFAGQVPQSRQNVMFLDATLNQSELIHVCIVPQSR